MTGISASSSPSSSSSAAASAALDVNADDDFEEETGAAGAAEDLGFRTSIVVSLATFLGLASLIGSVFLLTCYSPD